jgi:heme/copper-type cytochrome/quinol oxidase subunit 2
MIWFSQSLAHGDNSYKLNCSIFIIAIIIIIIVIVVIIIIIISVVKIAHNLLNISVDTSVLTSS